MIQYNLLLVGCGNMAGAMLSGWLDAGLVKQAVVIKPSPLTLKHDSITALTPQDRIPGDFTPDMIVLGVKPQMMADVLPAYRHYAGQAPFLSLAVGKTLAWFEAQLGGAAAVIRTMPNLAATIGKGVTGVSANKIVSEAERGIAASLLQAVGTVHWIDEAQINALNALSGSGPAYVFLLQEVMAQAGVKLGLDPALADSLARETVIGAAQLLANSPDDATTLRQRVTSKGGTTIAAMTVLLRDQALPDLFAAALAAAAARAKELAS